MTVDVFDIETFKKALPDGSFERGVEMGEHVFQVPVDNQVCVVVRSSIHEEGTSAKAGEDSIRMWLAKVEDGSLIGKLETYTTRVSGWESRLKQKILYLVQHRVKAGDCPDCEQPLHIFVVHKEGANHGRLFAKCMDCDSHFTWLDEPTTPYFSSKKKNNLLAALEESDAPGDMDVPDELPEEMEMGSYPVPEPLPQYQPNDEQSLAINSPFGPTRLQAGPGSGKTFTITHRYRYAITHGIPAEEIIAVTFNVKMAQELGAKIASMCPEIVGTPAERQICTIHALCFRFLKNFYPEYRSRQVAPDWWQKKTYDELLESMFSSDDRPIYAEVRDVIHTSKGMGYTRETCGVFYTNLLGDFYGDAMTNLRAKFDDRLRDNNYVTYDDQLLDMEVALRDDSEFKKYCQSRIKMVIVDEAQDTSGQAMRILTSLIDHTNNIFIVGDVDQLLYRFAGATPEVNLGEGFDERYLQNNTFSLVTNYRSTQEIVQVSRKVISNNYESGGGPYADKYFKELRAKVDAEPGREFDFQEYGNPLQEAQGVLEEIRSLLVSGSKPEDFFVGFRTRAQSGYLEAAFAMSEVPYINTAGVTFWELSHIQDILAFLRLIYEPDNKEAFARIINIPSNWWVVPWRNHPDFGTYVNHRFLGRSFLSDTNSSLQQLSRFMHVFKYAPGIKDILDLTDEISSVYYSEDISSAIRYIIDNSYKKFVLYEVGGSENTTGEGQRLDDLNTVIEIATQFKDIKEFFGFVDRMVEQSRVVAKGDWSGRVVLSTIHRLKGLERDYVFGVGCSETVPGDKPAGLLPHTFSLVPPPHEGKFDIYGKGRVEDERCLFYVLITRAKKGVYLSSVQNYRKFVFGPSRFIDEFMSSNPSRRETIDDEW